MSAQQGALIEPLAVAWNAANRCGLESGQIVAIHHAPLVIPPFEMLMPEVYVTGVAMSAHAFPSVIERLKRQEGLKILVEVAAR